MQCYSSFDLSPAIEKGPNHSQLADLAHWPWFTERRSGIGGSGPGRTQGPGRLAPRAGRASRSLRPDASEESGPPETWLRGGTLPQRTALALGDVSTAHQSTRGSVGPVDGSGIHGHLPRGTV